MTLSLLADSPNMNWPCQIYVVMEDKEPLQSLPATDISRPIRRGAKNVPSPDNGSLHAHTQACCLLTFISHI